MNFEQVEHGSRLILTGILGESLPEGMEESPTRMAKAFAELTKGYKVDIPALFKVFEHDSDDQIVAFRDMHFVSLCEHHAMVFTGMASVAYLPDKKVIGASKIARLVNAHANRFQLQERIASDVARDLQEYLSPKGVAVILQAEHSCMRCRGVKSESSQMVTSVMTGVFRDNQSSRMEVLSLLGFRQ